MVKLRIVQKNIEENAQKFF